MSNRTDEPNTPPAGTDPSATPPSGEPSTANDNDVKNVVSQRDRANERARQLEADKLELEERLARVEASDMERDKKETISDFLKENKEKYPDVELDDLARAEDPQELEALAEKAQKKYSAIEQRALSKLNVADEEKVPTLEEIKAKEKAILDNPEITDKFSAIQEARLAEYK